MERDILSVFHTPFIGGKRERTGFDAGEDRTPAGRADVEQAARDYANSRPCITRKAGSPINSVVLPL